MFSTKDLRLRPNAKKSQRQKLGGKQSKRSSRRRKRGHRWTRIPDRIRQIATVLFVLCSVVVIYALWPSPDPQTADKEDLGAVPLSESLESRPPTEQKQQRRATEERTASVNPLLRDQCRNAVIEHDRIQITADIAQNAALCPEFNGLFTRESLAAYKQSECAWKGQTVRSHSKVIEHFKNGGDLNQLSADEQWLSEFPIYLMLPKGSSSSIWSALQRNNHFAEEGDLAASSIEQNAIRGSKCLFTFTRSPISRVLSGYYTINAWIWRDHNGTFENVDASWDFVRIHGEPERFRTFVDELVSQPHRFTVSQYNDHVMSATTIFQQHLGTEDTELRFLGKVEHFEEDMARLKEICSYFEAEDQMVAHQMRGFGWAAPSSWHNEWEFHLNWIESTGSMPLYNFWKEHGTVDGLLPPAYFAVDEATHQKIVDFYIQDIRCFGYEHQIPYKYFMEEQLTAHNIYGDPKYNYERIEK